jgi:hypothetical protein
MKKAILLFSLIAAASTAGCGAAAMKADATYQGPSTSLEKSIEAGTKILIYNADVWFEIDPDQFEPAQNAIIEHLKGIDAYVVQHGDTFLKLRVKADQFNTFLHFLEKRDGFEKKSVYMTDKTEEYIDLKAKLANAEEFKVKYESLVKQAATVDEMLKLEKELERIQEKIEELKGKITFIENQTAYSTVMVYFDEDTMPGPIGWIFYGLYLGIKWLFVW